MENTVKDHTWLENKCSRFKYSPKAKKSMVISMVYLMAVVAPVLWILPVIRGDFYIISELMIFNVALIPILFISVFSANLYSFKKDLVTKVKLHPDLDCIIR